MFFIKAAYLLYTLQYIFTNNSQNNFIIVYLNEAIISTVKPRFKTTSKLRPLHY